MRNGAFAWIVMLAACAEVDLSQSTSGSGHTAELTFSTDASPSPLVVLLVVDDDPDASVFRDDLWAAASRSATPRGGYDPSHWRSLNWTAIVAHPRASGGRRWTGPADDPRLRIVSENVGDAEREAWVAAIDEAVTARPLDGPFRALEVARDGMALLLGEREPEGAREQTLMASLPDMRGEASFLYVVVAALQPDVSPEAIEAYAPPAQTEAPWLGIDAIYPSSTSDCSTFGEGSGRIAAWSAAYSGWTGLDYPCGIDHLTQRGLLSMGHVDSGFPFRFCASRPLTRDDAGRAVCRVEVKVRDPQAACDPARGWRDTATPLEEDERGPYRPCEMQHVPDAELERCAEDDECDGCSSGFCASNRELDRVSCGRVGMYPTLRFVGGTIAGLNTTVNAHCRLED